MPTPTPLPPPPTTTTTQAPVLVLVAIAVAVVLVAVVVVVAVVVIAAAAVVAAVVLAVVSSSSRSSRDKSSATSGRGSERGSGRGSVVVLLRGRPPDCVDSVTNAVDFVESCCLPSLACAAGSKVYQKTAATDLGRLQSSQALDFEGLSVFDLSKGTGPRSFSRPEQPFARDV